jgi:hypothetical protein
LARRRTSSAAQPLVEQCREHVVGRFGYGIVKKAEDVSGGSVRLTTGTLYGALDLDRPATAPATWLALTALSRLRPAARRTAPATLMAATGVLAIALAVTQAGPEPIDGNDALAGRETVNTLGAALFVTGASILLALAASGRRGSNPY